MGSSNYGTSKPRYTLCLDQIIPIMVSNELRNVRKKSKLKSAVFYTSQKSSEKTMENVCRVAS